MPGSRASWPSAGCRSRWSKRATSRAATTSQSSKLVHGGLRYLELFDFGLVRESLRERETLRRLAPHLVRPLPFLVPIYRDSSRSLIKVRIGLKLYDWLTPGRERERYRVLRAVDALSLEPTLAGRAIFAAPATTSTTCWSSPSGSASRTFCRPAGSGRGRSTTARSTEIARDERGAITGVLARDLLTGRVATLGARVVVNATGPWVDELRAVAAVSERGPQILQADEGHPLSPAATHRPRHLPLDRRRPHDLRHPVARVLAGRRDRHRFQR